ncbi:SDR family NAD(P)-dependent oxidoreductase [Kiritimatiellota bacterium B12222]|nr:SDR family NAD(P)-dependent oxidoreductase [Kiritimatiellota bacterium B12222]
MNKSVLITGTSSGIGQATALEMKKRGWTVYATARNQQDLDRLSEQGLIPVKMDMSDSASIAEGAKFVLEACNQNLYALVNNAGYGQPGALEDLTVESMRKQFDVNVIGLQHLTNQILPAMIQQGQGRVVHISSVVGRIALPFMGIYSASKFAVEALADVQRIELNGTGVKISLVEPGPIITQFSNNAVKSSEHELPTSPSRFTALYQQEFAKRKASTRNKPFALPPQAVAQKIAHALCSPHPRRRYQVTFPAHAGTLLRRFAPYTLLDYVFGKALTHRLPPTP